MTGDGCAERTSYVANAGPLFYGVVFWTLHTSRRYDARYGDAPSGMEQRWMRLSSGRLEITCSFIVRPDAGTRDASAQAMEPAVPLRGMEL